MSSNLESLKIDPALLSRLTRDTGRRLTRAELDEQRVSFVYGSVGAKLGLSREQVKRALMAHRGAEADAS